MAYDTTRYDNLYKEFEKKQLADAERQKTQTAQDYNKQLKEAYINRMQNQKMLNDNLTMAGIRGGATETSNLKLATNYQNTRNDLNQQKTRAMQDIDTNAQSNLFNYKQTNDAAKLSYIEQREAEDRQIAQANKEKAEAAQSDLWAAQYGSYYDIPSLNSAYNAAKTAEEKAIIKTRINYLTQYSRGY